MGVLVGRDRLVGVAVGRDVGVLLGTEMPVGVAVGRGVGVLVWTGMLVGVAVAVGDATKLISNWAAFAPDSRLGKPSEDVLGVVIPKLYVPSPVT